jgi:hypothetical protein
MPNYSLKPGRGPSAMGVVGGVVAILFGIGWTVMAFSITRGAPKEMSLAANVFPCFGVIFVLAAVAGLIYNLQNARGQNRTSEFDIVESESEPDPLAPKRSTPPVATTTQASTGGYCRSCGAALRVGDHFCGHCGKAVDIP